MAPTILEEMRYHSRYNFVGQRIDGYRDSVCLLVERAARALARAERAARARGYALKVYDCYRPQRAVDHFMRWSREGSARMKKAFFPRVPKGELVERGYVAARSSHSRGATVDITLVRRPPPDQPRYPQPTELTDCTAARSERYADNTIEMGTGYDCFDRLSHGRSTRVSSRARKNRALLRDLMRSAGFRPYAAEWWHFTLIDEPFSKCAFDVPVERPR